MKHGFEAAALLSSTASSRTASSRTAILDEMTTCCAFLAAVEYRDHNQSWAIVVRSKGEVKSMAWDVANHNARATERKRDTSRGTDFGRGYA